jgi:hypothetical protein
LHELVTRPNGRHRLRDYGWLAWPSALGRAATAPSPPTEKGVLCTPKEMRASQALAELPAGLRDFARRHTTRLAILALLSSKQQGDRSLDDLHVALPDTPARAAVEYHLGVLSRVGLICRHLGVAGAIYRLADKRLQ